MSERRELPDTRPSVTHKTVITDQQGQEWSLFITLGFYEDGTPAEVFFRVGKAGSTMSGLLDTIGILVSYALQYGVPLQDLCDKMQQATFEPAGSTTNEDIKTCNSLIDYAFTWLPKARLFGAGE